MIELRSRAGVLVLIAIFVAAGYSLIPYSAPVLMGIILCVVGWPAQKWVERRFHLPRWLAASLHALVWVAVIVLPAIVIVSTVASNISPMIPKWQAGTPLIHPPDDLAQIPVIGHWLWARLHAVNSNALLHYLEQHKDLVKLWLGGAWIFVLHTAIAAMIVFSIALRGERSTADLSALAARLWGTDGPVVLGIAADSARAVMLGIVGVGVGEGLLIGVAFAFAHVPLWSIWMVATILLSPVPFGAALVLLAAAGWLALSAAWIAAVATLAWGLAVIAAADILFRPIVSAGAGNVSFLLMLLSILGGAEMFGLVGVVTGPLLLGIAAGIWDRWFRDTLDAGVPPLAPAAESGKPIQT